MYCNSCGKFVESGAVFCTGCGKRLNETPATGEALNQQSVQAAETPAGEVQIPVVPPFNSGIYEKETPAPDMNSTMNEKTYFGKGALIFCLVIIGLLSISTGVFAGLYFSLL